MQQQCAATAWLTPLRKRARPMLTPSPVCKCGKLAVLVIDDDDSNDGNSLPQCNTCAKHNHNQPCSSPSTRPVPRSAAREAIQKLVLEQQAEARERDSMLHEEVESWAAAWNRRPRRRLI